MNKKTILIIIIAILMIGGLRILAGIINNPETIERPLMIDDAGNKIITANLTKDFLFNGVHCYKADGPAVKVIKAFDLNNDTEKQQFETIKSMCKTPDGQYHGINYYRIYHTQQLTNYPWWYAFKDVKVENHDLYVSYDVKGNYAVVTLTETGISASMLMETVNFKNINNNTTLVNATVEKISTDNNNNNKEVQSVSNDNPNNLPKSKSEIKTEYETKGYGYEGSLAQSQGMSESDYWNDIYAHQ